MNDHANRTEHANGTLRPSLEWVTATCLGLFFISTTLFDMQLMKSRPFWLLNVFLAADVFIQGYFLWYYFYRFRPAKRMLTDQLPEAVGTYSWLLVIAALSVSLVALLGAFAIHGFTAPR